MTISTTPNQPAFINLTAYTGPGDQSKQNCIQYESASSLMASATITSFRQLAAAASNQSFLISDLFGQTTGPIFLVVAELTTSAAAVGFRIGITNAGATINVGTSGFFACTIDATAGPPSTLYLTNSSSTAVCNLVFGAICK